MGEDEMAIGGRDAAHALYAFSMWENPSESEIHLAWACEPEGAAWGASGDEDPVGGLQLLAILGVVVLLVLLAGLVPEGYTGPA